MSKIKSLVQTKSDDIEPYPLVIKMPPVEGVSTSELKKAIDYSASLYATTPLHDITRRMPTTILTTSSVNVYLETASEVYTYLTTPGPTDPQILKTEVSVTKPVHIKSFDLILEGDLDDINRNLGGGSSDGGFSLIDNLSNEIKEYFKPLVVNIKPVDTSKTMPQTKLIPESSIRPVPIQPADEDVYSGSLKFTYQKSKL